MTQSVDPDFARRVAEYQSKHKKGLVFQADGTLGGKPMKRARPAWRSDVFRRTLQLLIFLALVKALGFHTARVFAIDGASRVVLDSSSIVQYAAGLVFYPDPLSVEMSKWLTLGQQYLAIELRKAL